jgi:hypothetical protein
MRAFHCDHCGLLVFFENTSCGRCGHRLAYLPDLKLVASLDPAPAEGGVDGSPGRWTSPVGRAEGRAYRLCDNYARHDVCNWAVPAEDPVPLCEACRLTRVIPDLGPPAHLVAWRRLEAAKRRLVYSLLELRLPVGTKAGGAAGGLEFRFMGAVEGGPPVLTGHAGGVITVNLAEADDVERERMRVSMHEPYRTLLGHFRHEVGHYYWDLLVRDTGRLDGFRGLFGDERADYGEALRRHYDSGPAADWPERCVSAYASVHPWEDWAETWAHYLHMTDTLETAAHCGMSLRPGRPDEPAMARQPAKPAHEQSFDEIVSAWFPLTYAMNSLNRGMGLADAYPFVLPPPAVEKLRFVHETVCAAAGQAAPSR